MRETTTRVRTWTGDGRAGRPLYGLLLICSVLFLGYLGPQRMQKAQGGLNVQAPPHGVREGGSLTVASQVLPRKHCDEQVEEGLGKHHHIPGRKGKAESHRLASTLGASPHVRHRTRQRWDASCPLSAPPEGSSTPCVYSQV